VKNAQHVQSAAAATDAGAERRTRARVAQLLLELGEATAADLGTHLGLSPAAVRRHLDSMLLAGTVVAGTVVASHAPGSAPRGRGRPARVFSLTEAGRDTFPQAYGDLAASALRFLAEHGGEQAVTSFARARVGELEERYAGRIAGGSPEERAESLAAALTEDGYAATAANGQVCQHHCPVQHVAEEFPQLCEAETEVFSRLLGGPVLRLTTIAHGESCCTSSVRAAAVPEEITITDTATPPADDSTAATRASRRTSA
jgi:predicted ArsR family transcriptional regulator